MSNELLEKVINDPNNESGNLKGGYLRAPQVRRFFDYMYDSSVLGSQVRVERVTADIAELTRIGVGRRLLRVATEAVNDGVNVGAAFSKISLTTTKFRLDWEVSTEALEDGLEGGDLEDHIARLMAAQVAIDMEDYAINASLDNTTDPGLGAFDGWSATANRIGHTVDAGGQRLTRNVLSAMLKKMPRDHMTNRQGLKFFTSSNALQDLLDAEAVLSLDVGRNTSTSSNDNVSGPLGYNAPKMYGQAVQEVPLFAANKVGTYSGAGASAATHGEVWLTNPQNLIWAVKREVKVYHEFIIKKDTTEYTLFTRFGTAIEDGNGIVVAKNVQES